MTVTPVTSGPVTPDASANGPLSDPTRDTMDRVRALVLRHGYNSNDFLALYSGWRYFLCDAPDGVVMYVERGRTYVACGDPICAPKDLEVVFTAFRAYAGRHRRRAAFLGASERLAAAAVGHGFGALKVGEEPFFEVATYAPRGDRAKKVRSAVNQARRVGVTTRVYRPSGAIDVLLEGRTEALCRAWQASRPAGEMCFGLTLEPFTEREAKRYVIAEQGGRMVGFLACSPMPARHGYYLEDVIRSADAPNGTTEMLVLAALDALRDEGVAVASLGVAPLAGVERQPYGRHAALCRVLALARNHMSGAYHFASLNHYKRKFAPSFWEGSYLLYAPARLTPALAWSLISAFTPDSPLASLKEAARRRVRAAVRRQRSRSSGRHAAVVLLLALSAVFGLLLAEGAGHHHVERLLSIHHLGLLWPLIVMLLLAAAIAVGRRLPRRARLG
jgi:phosphatidylglycerol lysyltransferase